MEAQTLHSATLLIVDDDPLITDLFSQYMSRRNFHVLRAESGQEALEIVAREQADIQLVVTDMTMPCILPGCIPAGPGMISKGSATVTICGLPAARVGDMTAHSSCVAPIPSPTGTIMPPGCPTVLIGG